jgi:hypothetical protein
VIRSGLLAEAAGRVTVLDTYSTVPACSAASVALGAGLVRLHAPPL